MEYVGTQRRAYAQLKSKSKKTAFIDSMCQAFGFERKYATKLLTGNRKYKEPKGRGKTYSDKATGLLRRVWYATGCMCTKYLKTIIVRALANLAELEHVDSALSMEVASMSASTMDRALKGLERIGPGSVRKNRRSGKNDPAAYFTCCSGEKEIAAETEPGHMQVDTVALCGGDMRGNFFWIITLTDRKTQWTEIYPVWNKGAEEVLNAVEILVRRFPFKILSLHYDNGKKSRRGLSPWISADSASLAGDCPPQCCAGTVPMDFHGGSPHGSSAGRSCVQNMSKTCKKSAYSIMPSFLTQYIVYSIDLTCRL